MWNRMSRRRLKSSRGSALVEAAFVLIPFAAMLIGIVDFGQFLFIHQALVERARYAARWGAVTDPTNTTAIQNMVLYNQPTASTGSGYFGLTASMVQVTTQDSGTDDYRLVVNITNYPYQVFSLFISGTYYGPNVTISVPLGFTG
jgi:Flp pilus assembly protein TadG